MLYRFCLKFPGSSRRDCRTQRSFDLPEANQNRTGILSHHKPENSNQMNIKLLLVLSGLVGFFSTAQTPSNSAVSPETRVNCPESANSETGSSPPCDNKTADDHHEPPNWFEAYSRSKDSPGLYELMRFCRENFRKRKERTNCQSLHPALVWSMKETYDALKASSEERLNSIHRDDLLLLLNIGPSALGKAVHLILNSDKPVFIKWLAENRPVTEVIADNDDSFMIFSEIFDMSLSMDDSTVSNELNLFVQTIASGENNNEQGLTYVFNFFHKLCQANTPEPLCIFKQYCQLDLTHRQEIELIEKSDKFQGALNEILESYEPDTRPEWWEKGLFADDLHSWKSRRHNICGALASDFAKL